jgi:serine protease Do
MRRTTIVGVLGVAALLVAATASAEPIGQDPNKVAANAARRVGDSARSVAGYTDRVADHYDGESRATEEAAKPAPKKAVRKAKLAPSAAPKAPAAAAPAAQDDKQQPQAAARQGVVTLERQGEVLGVGSVLSGDGRILTALSNLGNGNDIDVRYADGSLSRVRVGHTDRAWDLALLVPQNGRWTQGLRASRMGTAQVGSDTHHFSLHGQKLHASRTILEGQRTLLGGDSELLRDAIRIGSNLEGTDVGSPVLDKNGEVVAMVARACSPSEDGQVCSPVTYGVPVNALRAFLRTVPASAVPPAPWLGVRGVANDSGSVRGVRLLRVDPQSPAAAAGLRGSEAPEQADMIVAVNGAPITTPEALSTEVNNRAVGDSLQLLVYGNGKFREVTMTLRAAPSRPPAAPAPTAPATETPAP